MAVTASRMSCRAGETSARIWRASTTGKPIPSFRCLTDVLAVFETFAIISIYMLTRTLGILGLALLPVSLTAQRPPVMCNAPRAEPRGPVPVRVPIELSGNHVLLSVCAGGTRRLFILDTGAGVNVIDIGVAKASGFTLGDPVNIGGAGAGVVRGAQVRTGTLTVPGLAGSFAANI